MNCNNCGNILPEGNGFCPKCGTPFNNTAAPAAQTQPAGIYGPNDTSAQATQYSPVAQPNKKSKAPLIIGLSVGALVLVVALVIILLFACSGNSTTEDNPQGTITNYLNALAERDIETMAEAFYPSYFTIEGTTAQAYCAEEAQDSYDYVKGGITNLKVTNIENVDAEEVAAANLMCSYLDDYIEMKGGVSVSGEYTTRYEGESITIYFEADLVLCDDDDYYLLDMDLYNYYY